MNDRGLFRKLMLRFMAYSGSFASEIPDYGNFFRVKKIHSVRVGANMLNIARDEGFPEEIAELARIAGLYHDVGRFEQYRVYRTFSDEDSVNHAALGIRIIKEKNLLKELGEQEREDIFTAILNHNIYQILHPGTERAFILSKLLRDSDKLDILKFMAEDEEFAEMYVKDCAAYTVSDAIYHSFFLKRNVRIEDAHTLYDFMLLRLSWIYDINFASTLGRIIKHRYFDSIMQALPEDERIREISAIVRERTDEFAAQKTGNDF